MTPTFSDHYRRTRRRATDPPYIVDPAKAQQHIAALKAADMTYVAIAAAAGIARTGSIQEIVKGARKEGILSTTEAKILAVQPDATWVSTVGLIRRVRALAALGYTSTQIADQAGLYRCVAARLMRGVGTYATRDTGEAITLVYEELSMTPAVGSQATRQRRFAAARKWAPPLAWDEGALDDAKARAVGLSGNSRIKRSLDEVAIRRRMAGEAVHTHGEENREVVRRLYAAGHSLQWIDAHTGLKSNRYVHVTVEGAARAAQKGKAA